MRARAAVALAVVALAGSHALPAAAQAPPPVHKADALFNAGRSLLEAGEYEEACPKFAEANTLAPGLGVTLYLADCYERLGKTQSALFWFRKAVELASAKKDKRGPVAAARALALVPRVPSLVVRVSPEAQAQHVEVARDGAPLPASAWGAATPLDPGDHVLDVTAAGRVARHVAFHLAATAETHTETVAPLDAPPPAPAALPPAIVDVTPPPPPPPPAPEPPPRSHGHYLAIAAVTAGVGVVGIGVGAVMGVVASSKLSDSNAGPCDSSNHCTPAGLALRSDAVHAGNTSTIAFVAGGALVGAGVVVFLLRPKEGSAVGSVALSPAIAQGGGGFTLGGAF